MASGGHRDPTMLTGNDCVKNDVYSRAYSKTSTSCGIFPLRLDLNHILFLPCLSAQCLLPRKGLREPFAGGKKNKMFLVDTYEASKQQCLQIPFFRVLLTR